MYLTRMKAEAQASANKWGQPMTIFNLNQFSPLYVVRVYKEGDEARKGFVARFDPQA